MQNKFGAPSRARKVKVLKAGWLALWPLLTVGLVACGGNSGPASPTATATATAAAIAGSPTPAPITPGATATPAPLVVAPTVTPVPPTPVASLPPAPTAPAAGSSPSVAAMVSSASPPTQPARGPGGSEYLYTEVNSKRYGSGPEAYHIFEPGRVAPGQTLPLVVLLHGYAGVNPNDSYRGWIDHVVKKGNIVIFPVYQLAADRDGENFTTSAVAGLKAALQELQTGAHVRPDLDKFFLTGYSAGGVIAANMAAQAGKYGLPVPKALFPVTPGGCANCSIFAIRNFTLAQPTELASINPNTRVVLLAGDRDTVVGETATTLIWQGLAHIPATNRNYLLALTDNYGRPALIADHGMANRTPPNAYNFYAIWKIFDALQDCTISGKNCEYALGGTPQQRNLGSWSDGRPVTELKVIG